MWDIGLHESEHRRQKPDALNVCHRYGAARPARSRRGQHSAHARACRQWRGAEQPDCACATAATNHQRIIARHRQRVLSTRVRAGADFSHARCGDTEAAHNTGPSEVEATQKPLRVHVTCTLGVYYVYI